MQTCKEHRQDGKIAIFSSIQTCAHTHTHTHTHTDLCSRKAFVSIITAYPRVTVKFLVLINVLSAETKRRVGLDVRGRVGQKERSSLCPSIRLGKKSFVSLSLPQKSDPLQSIKRILLR